MLTVRCPADATATWQEHLNVAPTRTNHAQLLTFFVAFHFAQANRRWSGIACLHRKTKCEIRWRSGVFNVGKRNSWKISSDLKTQNLKHKHLNSRRNRRACTLAFEIDEGSGRRLVATAPGIAVLAPSSWNCLLEPRAKALLGPFGQCAHAHSVQGRMGRMASSFSSLSRRSRWWLRMTCRQIL